MFDTSIVFVFIWQNLHTQKSVAFMEFLSALLGSSCLLAEVPLLSVSDVTIIQSLDGGCAEHR